MDKELNRRCGRGSNGPNFARLGEGDFASRNELLSSAVSKSTQANIKRAKKVLDEYSRQHGTSDPEQVSVDSSLFVMNLLAKYCKFGAKDSLRDDSMGALVQGLRYVYEENGHTSTWTWMLNLGRRQEILLSAIEISSF